MNEQYISKKYLIACLLCATSVCFSQVLGYRILILASLGLFCVLVTHSVFYNHSLAILLFFLPWSALLKVAPGHTSFFTVALVALCLLHILKKNMQIDVRFVLLALGLAIITLFAKLVDGNGITLDYLMFLFLVALFPGVSKELERGTSFKTLTIFFAVGVACAALSAQYLVVFPTIARYIVVDTVREIVRLSGFYGDPNFYSAHIAAALSGIGVLLLSEREKKDAIAITVLAVILLYCGFLSGSKAFVIVLAIVLLLWLVSFLTSPIRGQTKLGGILLLVLVGGFVFSSSVFSDVLSMLQMRFLQADNLAELTTGRNELWTTYFSAIIKSPKIFLIGQGFVNVIIGDHATHNTVLQIVYQFGILGAIILLAWTTVLVRDICHNKAYQGHWLRPLILLLGGFGMWLSIDLVFFDEFFLMPVYIAAGLIWNPENRELEIDSGYGV